MMTPATRTGPRRPLILLAAISNRSNQAFAKLDLRKTWAGGNHLEQILMYKQERRTSCNTDRQARRYFFNISFGELHTVLIYRELYALPTSSCRAYSARISWEQAALAELHADKICNPRPSRYGKFPMKRYCRKVKQESRDSVSSDGNHRGNVMIPEPLLRIGADRASRSLDLLFHVMR